MIFRMKPRRSLSGVFRRHRTILLILLAGLLVRIPILIFNEGILWPDSNFYLFNASGIAAKLDFASHHVFVTPLYPLYLSFFIRFLPETPTAGFFIILFQHLMGLLSTVLVYRTARRIFNPATATWSALLFSLNPLVLYYEHVVQTETLFILILCMLIHALSSLADVPTYKQDLIIGILSAALTLTRPVAKMFVFIVLFFLVIKLRRIKPILPHALVISAVYILLLFPWMLSNYRHLGFFDVGRGEGINLYLRLVVIEKLDAADDVQTYKPGSPVEIKPRSFFQREAIEDRQKLSYAVSLIKKYPWRFISGSLRNWIRTFIDPEDSIHFSPSGHPPYLCCRHLLDFHTERFPNRPRTNSAWVLFFLYYYFSYFRLPQWLAFLLFLLGAFLFFRQKRATQALGLLALICILYFSLSQSILLEPIDRLRLPGDVFYFMFVSFAVTRGLSWLRTRARPRRGK